MLHLIWVFISGCNKSPTISDEAINSNIRGQVVDKNVVGISESKIIFDFEYNFTDETMINSNLRMPITIILSFRHIECKYMDWVKLQ